MASLFLMLVLCTFFTSSTNISAQIIKKGVRPFIIILDNGTIVRDDAIPLAYEPPQTPDPTTKVTSKDITLDSTKKLTARMYLPALTHSPSKKLPILVYFHGGGFCIGSAFSELDHVYLNALTSQSNTISISINYRLFPEFTLPAAFEDVWFALEWVASQSQSLAWTEPWLATYGDFSKLFLGGDSSGATIVHNLAMRASREVLMYDLHIYGAILTTPHFLGSTRVPLELANVTLTPYYRVWRYVCPHCVHGVDDPTINPVGPRSPTLRRLAVEKVMVYTAENDPLLGRGVSYVTGIRGSKWEGILTYYEGKNVSHVFNIMSPKSHETKVLISRIAEFLQS